MCVLPPGASLGNDGFPVGQFETLLPLESFLPAGKFTDDRGSISNEKSDLNLLEMA
jgi:hypothetical protein